MRLFARPGDKLYSRLSVNAQLFAKISHVMKVGRNNFNPPPQVESNVVRIEPKNPRPDISFEEFDGMLRIVFVRKNRTLRAAFLGTQSVIDLLTRNWRVWCAQNDIPIDESPEEAEDVGMEIDPIPAEDEWNGFSDVEDEDGDAMAEDDELPDFFKQEKAKKSVNGANRKRRGRVTEVVREKIRKVLEDETLLADKRGRLCDEGDFLKLLYAFNQEGIHFS